MVVEALPLTSIGVIIVIAIALSVVVRKSGQNAVLGYIIAGAILGPMFIGFLHPEDPLVVGFGELGLFILLFYLGLELSLKDFIKAGATSVGLALIDMACLVGMAFAISYFFGYSILFSVIVGMMAFSTSTAIVAKFALDKGLISNSAAKLAISILILQDFLGIVLLVFIISLSKAGGQSGALGLGLAALVFAVAAFFAVSKLSKIVEAWMKKNGFGYTEITLYALGVGLVVATLGTILGLSAALGAYFAGFALAETESGTKIKKNVGFLRDFMLVFFFVAFGTTLFFNHTAGLVELPELGALLGLGAMALAITIGIIIVNGIVFHIFGGMFGLTRKDSSLAAVMLVPLGEFVAIIATNAIPVLGPTESALISPIAFLLILITVILFSPLYSLLPLHEKIFGKLPSLFAHAPKKTIEKPHTSYTIQQLKKFGLNAFVVLCFAWLTVLLYYTLPRFNTPLMFSRQITAMAIFAFFAFVPFMNAAKALEKLFWEAIREVKREVKRFGHKKWAYAKRN